MTNFRFMNTKNQICKLYIEPSSLCNLNCSMCFRNNWFDETYGLMKGETVDQILKILSIDMPFDVFFGGMGEPLMHPRIFGMVETASKHNRKVELITNATLLSERVSRKLIDSGLDTLWISMDGFSRESYEAIRRGSLYQKIIHNIAGFNKVRRNAKLGITFVMMGENLSQLPFINRFADEFGVDLLNLSHVLPGTELLEEASIYELPYRVGKMYRFSETEVFPKEQDICPFIKDQTCFIRYDGAVVPCMQLLHNSYTYLYTEKRKVSAHSFGKITEMPFEEIYYSKEYTEFRRRVMEFSFPCCTICSGCDYRLENVTDCIYNTAPTCGACLWAQGLVRCP